LSLYFNWAPRHEGVLEWRYSSTHSLTSALDGGEWSASCPVRFIPRERATGTHWIGGWVGPRAVLDAVVKRRIPSTRRESIPRTPIVQLVAQRYTDWATYCNSVELIWEISLWLTAEYVLILTICSVNSQGKILTNSNFNTSELLSKIYCKFLSRCNTVILYYQINLQMNILQNSAVKAKLRSQWKKLLDALLFAVGTISFPLRVRERKFIL
jgi:hypothetical protein